MGLGLGAFIDGIVLHQVLQWHHMLTSTRKYPMTTVAGLEAGGRALPPFDLDPGLRRGLADLARLAGRPLRPSIASAGRIAARRLGAALVAGGALARHVDRAPSSEFSS
jgi:hypothetical protein